MPRYLPPWKSYEVPDACKSCPYIVGFEQHIQNRAQGTHDPESALGLSGLSAELRGRKRRAQECVGPAVVNASVAFCETVHDYVDSDGVIIKARIDPQESRAFHDMTVEDVLGPEPPAEDQ